MIHSTFRIILCCLVLCGTACTAYNTVTTQKAHELRACKINCKERWIRCDQTCRNSCQHCTPFANASAARSYNQFKHEQCVQGGIVSRELKSYRDPLQCRKTTCDCRADYQICIEACKGFIHKRLQVAPICC